MPGHAAIRPTTNCCLSVCLSVVRLASSRLSLDCLACLSFGGGDAAMLSRDVRLPGPTFAHSLHFLFFPHSTYHYRQKLQKKKKKSNDFLFFFF